MEKTRIAIISFIFGAVAGSIATYFVMKQQMEPELEVVYEPNDEIKERIKDNFEKKVDTERKVVTESTKQEDEQDKKEYENIIRKYNHQLNKPEVDIRDMLNKKPYLISEEDYATTNLNYDKDSMTYYAEDDVLTDDCDEMVDDPGRFDEAVKVLLDSTNDETEVYIRDDSTYTDYAVSISNGSYQREVLGYIEELEDEPRRPKHKKDEDE